MSVIHCICYITIIYFQNSLLVELLVGLGYPYAALHNYFFYLNRFSVHLVYNPTVSNVINLTLTYSY